MILDKDNSIIQLCISGMEMEGKGLHEEALELFHKAWMDSTDDLEKFISAHYVARQQKSTNDKLTWDEIALKHAQNMDFELVKGHLSSLFLNIGKCHEDLGNLEKASVHYNLALDNCQYLENDGYGQMIKKGISAALERLS